MLDYLDTDARRVRIRLSNRTALCVAKSAFDNMAHENYLILVGPVHALSAMHIELL